MKIGFVGYSDESKYDEQNAREIIADIFDEIVHNDSDITIVSGATDVGIPRLVYEQAVKSNVKSIVGITAKEAYQYDLFPCDVIYAVGDKFGDESEFLIDYIDVLYKIGGGEQSEKEYKMAKSKNIPCREYIL